MSNYDITRCDIRFSKQQLGKYESFFYLLYFIHSQKYTLIKIIFNNPYFFVTFFLQQSYDLHICYVAPLYSYIKMNG